MGGVPRPKSERGHKEARLLPRPLTLRMLINQAANRWLGRVARPFDRAEDTALECGSRETMERPVRVKAWVEENRGSFLPPVCNKLL